jgi:hypothetical protein
MVDLLDGRELLTELGDRAGVDAELHPDRAEHDRQDVRSRGAGDGTDVEHQLVVADRGDGADLFGLVVDQDECGVVRAEHGGSFLLGVEDARVASAGFSVGVEGKHLADGVAQGLLGVVGKVGRTPGDVLVGAHEQGTPVPDAS